MTQDNRRIQCFIVEPTDMVEMVLLRREPFEQTRLQLGHCHKAELIIGRDSRNAPRVGQCDPRWPTHCDCGYAFTEQDVRQVLGKTLYRDTSTGAAYTVDTMPPGAMLEQEGQMLVMTPGGWWQLDRRGQIPLHITEAITQPGYKGVLRRLTLEQVE